MQHKSLAILQLNEKSKYIFNVFRGEETFKTFWGCWVTKCL